MAVEDVAANEYELCVPGIYQRIIRRRSLGGCTYIGQTAAAVSAFSTFRLAEARHLVQVPHRSLLSHLAY